MVYHYRQQERESLLMEKGSASNTRKLKSYNKIILNMDNEGYGPNKQHKETEQGSCYLQPIEEQSSSFQLPNLQRCKYRKVQEQNKRRRGRRFKENGWSLKENLLYMRFLKNNIGLFEYDKSQRQSIKINVKISRVVRTRTSNQCRSHHQKMIQYHKDVPSIIRFIENMQQEAVTHSQKLQRNPQTQKDSGSEAIEQVEIEQEQDNFQKMLQIADISPYFQPAPHKILWYDDSEIPYF